MCRIERAISERVPTWPRESAAGPRRPIVVRSVGGDFGGFYGLARQWIVGALIELADAVAVEALLFDLKIGPQQQFRRQFLNGKADRFRRRRKTLVTDGSARFTAAAGK